MQHPTDKQCQQSFELGQKIIQQFGKSEEGAYDRVLRILADIPDPMLRINFLCGANNALGIIIGTVSNDRWEQIQKRHDVLMEKAKDTYRRMISVEEGITDESKLLSYGQALEVAKSSAFMGHARLMVEEMKKPGISFWKKIKRGCGRVIIKALEFCAA